MSNPVTLVVWRDAKTNPPATANRKRTDSGFVYCLDGDWQDRTGHPMVVEPTIWCNPTPPSSDPLTLDDLRYLLRLSYQEPMMPPDVQNRLRKALEGATP